MLKQVLNAADSDSDKTKAKRSEVSQLQKPREQEENRNSSKVESTYWGVSQARYCSLGPTKPASHNFYHSPHVQCAEAHWCMAQCKASYAYILLVLK